MNEPLRTTKEIAELIGVSKSTVYRFIKSHSIHESSQNGSTLLYDESIQKLIIQHFNSERDSERINYESIEFINNELISALKNQIKIQTEQLIIKDSQIAELNKSNNHLQSLLLYEQQKNIKVLEENLDTKKWWHLWKI